MNQVNQRNIKLVLEYDGTDFSGWQIQPNGRSVQGEVQVALRQLLQEEVNVVGAGRTDSGVHARGQVANFRTANKKPVLEIHKALEGLLPEDILISSVQDVHADFHARYSAWQRRYGYYITREVNLFNRRYAWYVSYSLKSSELQAAAKLVEGEHDFEAFSKTDSGIDSYVCNVHSSCWLENGAQLVYQITADHFVRGMVRALVGTMVDVGRGFIGAQDFKLILQNKKRQEAGMAAPAHGLFLEEVMY